MKLVGLMPVRNEAWVLGLSARVALTWCDELILGMHACFDESIRIAADISKEHPQRVWSHFNIADTWDEMTHRERLLKGARHQGATHIAMIDADEILTGNLVSKVDSLTVFPYHILQLPLYNLRGGIHRYHANGLWGNRIVSLAFKDSPELHWGGDTFHQREPRGRMLVPFQPIAQGEGGVMHLWASSIERCRAKHRLYRITERIRWPEKDVRQIEFMYSQWERGGLREDPKSWIFKDVSESWWSPYKHLMKYLDVDAPNWQDAECDRLIEQYGRDYFKGLTI